VSSWPARGQSTTWTASSIETHQQDTDKRGVFRPIETWEALPLGGNTSEALRTSQRPFFWRFACLDDSGGLAVHHLDTLKTKQPGTATTESKAKRTRRSTAKTTRTRPERASLVPLPCSRPWKGLYCLCPYTLAPVALLPRGLCLCALHDLHTRAKPMHLCVYSLNL